MSKILCWLGFHRPFKGRRGLIHKESSHEKLISVTFCKRCGKDLVTIIPIGEDESDAKGFNLAQYNKYKPYLKGL